MDKYQLTETFNKLYQDLPVKEAENQIEKLLEQHCNKITIHFPTLDHETLKPVMHLCNQHCPRGLEGDCDNCEHFVAYKGGSEIFSYMSFDAYCMKEDDANGEEKAKAKAEGYSVSENPEISDDTEGADQRPEV